MKSYTTELTFATPLGTAHQMNEKEVAPDIGEIILVDGITRRVRNRLDFFTHPRRWAGAVILHDLDSEDES